MLASPDCSKFRNERLLWTGFLEIPEEKSTGKRAKKKENGMKLE